MFFYEYQIKCNICLVKVVFSTKLLFCVHFLMLFMNVRSERMRPSTNSPRGGPVGPKGRGGANSAEGEAEGPRGGQGTDISINFNIFTLHVNIDSYIFAKFDIS